jgi:hypothetical protein
MDNPVVLEACYKKYMDNITKWLPDGITEVDLALLHRLNLLHYHDYSRIDPTLTRFFHVIESDEKITLVNDEFVVWIVPDKQNEVPTTYTLIALNKEDNVQLELAFSVSGIYNTSKLVLRILEKYLHEIQLTEDFLTKLTRP